MFRAICYYGYIKTGVALAVSVRSRSSRVCAPRLGQSCPIRKTRTTIPHWDPSYRGPMYVTPPPLVRNFVGANCKQLAINVPPHSFYSPSGVSCLHAMWYGSQMHPILFYFIWEMAQTCMHTPGRTSHYPIMNVLCHWLNLLTVFDS